MKKSLIALCAVFALPFAAFAVAPPPPPPPLPPGSTMDSSRYDAPKTIASNEITMFKVQFTTSGGTYMTKKGDQWVEDVEMNVRRPNGSYFFRAVREDGRAHIWANFSEKERYEYTAPLSALDKLHRDLIANDLPKLNGFSKRNSALGVFFWVDVKYASGETISASGEGGASCSPPVGLGFLIDTFRALTEQYVPKSERPNWPDYEALKRSRRSPAIFDGPVFPPQK